MITFPPDQVLREMARLALEQGAQMFAARAREFAANIPSDISGRDALIAFAKAIENTNAQLYPNEGRKS